MTTGTQYAPVAPEVEDFAAYLQLPGLSNSMMKDLAVSPLRFWHRWIRPDREPDEPTPEMQVGSAVHCAVLEPAEFNNRYACELIAPEGCLVTMEDLREFIRSRGGTPKGTRKVDVIQQATAIDPATPIFDVLANEHMITHAGKTIFKQEDWQRIAGAADSLMEEPRVQSILKSGSPEVALTRSVSNGVVLKGRLDWVADDLTFDIKTFSQWRGKSIDRSIYDAIWNEGYHHQAYIYAYLRGWPEWRGQHVIGFVESEAPHEVRLVSISDKTGHNANLLWTRATLDVRERIRTYVEYMEKFGVDKPWRYARSVEAVMDEDIPQLAFS